MSCYDTGTYKPDDIVSSLLSMWCAQLAQMAHLVALANGMNRVYFCGGFVEHEKVQELITGQFNKRNGFAKV